MTGARDLLLWDKSDQTALFDRQDLIGVLFWALVEYREKFQAPPPPGVHYGESAVCIHDLVAEFEPFERQFENSQELVNNLLTCLAWPPGHLYHVTFFPALPAILELRFSFEALFERWRNQFDLLQAAVQKLEAAAFAYEQGKAVVDGENRVIQLEAPAAEPSLHTHD